MARKQATPAQIWKAWSDLGSLAIEAQMVVTMRMLGMAGAWPVGKSENSRMVSEKPPAFARAAQAATAKALAGGRPDQILSTAAATLTRTARANRKRLVRGAGSGKAKPKAKGKR